jgi:hypothetical protein
MKKSRFQKHYPESGFKGQPLREKPSPLKKIFCTKVFPTRLEKSQGFLESVGFVFARHGIFLEHGVGRGRPVGSSQAEAAKQPWLLRVLPGQIEELADILEERYADIAANELRFLIPGIIDTKITR